MRHRLVSTIVASGLTFAGIIGVSLLTTSPAHARDMDCAGFANQRDAQAYYLSRGGPASDPDRLDADGDGVACETTPCPCSTGADIGAQPAPTPVTPVAPAAPAPEPRVDKQKRQNATIVRVVDGDTVVVRLASGSQQSVRMIGIDTPEVYGGAECGGEAASRFAKRVLPSGTPAVLTSDPTQDLKDRYGRILRYVATAAVPDFGRLQLEQGNAEVYVFDRPFKRVDSYRTAQSGAERRHRGLWNRC